MDPMTFPGAVLAARAPLGLRCLRLLGTSGRHPSLLDVGIDSIGALLFLFALALWLLGRRARGEALRQDRD
jgi:hypothetical protein